MTFKIMKIKIMKISLSILLSLLLLSCTTETISNNKKDKGQNVVQSTEVTEITEDYKNIESAILGYVEGIYEGDSTLMEKSIHPELRKRGYRYNMEEKKYSDHLDMTYKELVHLAATWNADGKREIAGLPKEVKIFEISDKTASAKVTAKWGIDYFHLAKLDNQWYIMNVLWQSAPR